MGIRIEALKARLAGWPVGSDAPAFDPALRAAAVLIPVVVRENGLTILLTQRTDHLHHHPGQISFPGGRMEAQDGTPETAALRETREEIGLDIERITLIARLPQYITRTGFDVTPVVGVITPPFTLQPDSFEVAEVFEVPLDFLLERQHWSEGTIERQGIVHRFDQVPYAQRNIWGVTAGILKVFRELIATGVS